MTLYIATKLTVVFIVYFQAQPEVAESDESVVEPITDEEDDSMLQDGEFSEML